MMPSGSVERTRRIRVAKFVFGLDALLGLLAVGGAALFGVAYSSGNPWAAFFAVFIPFGLLWLLFCFVAYQGLTSGNVFLNIVFWLFVVGNVFGFPVGTAIACVCIWLWRVVRGQPGEPDPAL